MKQFVSAKRLVELHPDLLSTSTLQRWRSEGVGPPFVVLGPRRVAYDLAAFGEWAANRTVGSTAAARGLLPS